MPKKKTMTFVELTEWQNTLKVGDQIKCKGRTGILLGFSPKDLEDLDWRVVLLASSAEDSAPPLLLEVPLIWLLPLDY